MVLRVIIGIVAALRAVLVPGQAAALMTEPLVWRLPSTTRWRPRARGARSDVVM